MLNLSCVTSYLVLLISAGTIIAIITGFLLGALLVNWLVED